MPRLGFTGDVMLGRKVNEAQRERPATAVWGDVLDRLRALDGLFINLECCLSTRGERWTRTHRPFHFRADPDRAVSALEATGVDWANLANNHLLDYGETALRDTLDHLDSASVAHSGAGRNLETAREPAVVEVGDSRIALVSATDNTPEFGADESNPGTAYLDLRDERESREVLASQLARARERDPDLLVASLHWGPNMVEEPPRRFRTLARWLSERGADLIHGHSAHVFQGVELHDGTPILYDCGDFVDDYAVDSEFRNDRSFLFEVEVRSGGVEELRLLPTEIGNFSVYGASASAAGWSSERIQTLSKPFGTGFDTDDEELVLRP